MALPYLAARTSPIRYNSFDTALLRDAGWHVNRRRVERIWRREGLKVPQKQPKRSRLWLNDGSCIRPFAPALSRRQVSPQPDAQFLIHAVGCTRVGASSQAAKCLNSDRDGDGIRARLASADEKALFLFTPAVRYHARRYQRGRVDPAAKPASKDAFDHLRRQEREANDTAQIGSGDTFTLGYPGGDIMKLTHEPGSRTIMRIMGGSWRGKHRDEIASTGYVAHSLEAALWCVGRTSTYDEAVLLAANLAGDADTTAAITGQLAGALYGAKAIVTDWKLQLAMGTRILTSARDLFAASLPAE